MWEDQYQVYCRHGDGEYDLRASDMTIEDAVLFVKAVFQESYNDQELRFEIRRQSIEPKEGT
jgi:hypothetical protein